MSFVVEYRVRKNTKTVAYGLKNVKSGMTKEVTPEELLALCKKQRVRDLHLSKRGTICGSALRCPEVSSDIVLNLSEFKGHYDIYLSPSADAVASRYKSEGDFVLKALTFWLDNYSGFYEKPARSEFGVLQTLMQANQIVTLTGLPNTGKTTLAKQFMHSIINKKIAYIRVKPAASAPELLKLLSTIKLLADIIVIDDMRYLNGIVTDRIKFIGRKLLLIGSPLSLCHMGSSKSVANLTLNSLLYSDFTILGANLQRIDYTCMLHMKLDFSDFQNVDSYRNYVLAKGARYIINAIWEDFSRNAKELAYSVGFKNSETMYLTKETFRLALCLALVHCISTTYVSAEGMIMRMMHYENAVQATAERLTGLSFADYPQATAYAADMVKLLLKSGIIYTVANLCTIPDAPKEAYICTNIAVYSSVITQYEKTLYDLRGCDNTTPSTVERCLLTNLLHYNLNKKGIATYYYQRIAKRERADVIFEDGDFSVALNIANAYVSPMSKIINLPDRNAVLTYLK